MSTTLTDKLARLDTLLSSEMARCHATYDADREALAEHHEAMTAEETRLVAKGRRLRAKLAPFVEGGKPLPPDFDRAVDVYLSTMARLQQVRSARWMAYPASQPPGTEIPGQPIGSEPMKEDAGPFPNQ